MEEAHALKLHPVAEETLLKRNRDRCCVCRNPAKPVEIYSIGNRSYKYDPEGMAVLCADCFELAAGCKRDSGEQLFKDELALFKSRWENECDAWRNDQSFAIRFKQGEIVRDAIGYYGMVVDYFECSPDDGLHIHMTGDELFTVLIQKVNVDGDLSLRTYYESEEAYELDFTYSPPKAGSYAVIVRNESDKKVTVNIRSPLLAYVLERVTNLEEISFDKPENAVSETDNDASSINIDDVPWRILPPGEHPFPHLLENLEYLRHHRNRSIIEERIGLINSLKPTNMFCGVDHFRGYIIFYFEEARVAVLDCPIFGNAVYVISGNWQFLSRLSKKELLDQYADNVTRVVHRGDWFNKISGLIQI